MVPLLCRIWLLLALPSQGLCWMCTAAAPAAEQTQCQGLEWAGTHQIIAQRHSMFKSLRQFSSWITADASLPRGLMGAGFAGILH